MFGDAAGVRPAVESLERFVAGEPFCREQECVFGVLALESEPMDPRLKASRSSDVS